MVVFKESISIAAVLLSLVNKPLDVSSVVLCFKDLNLVVLTISVTKVLALHAPLTMTYAELMLEAFRVSMLVVGLKMELQAIF